MAPRTHIFANALNLPFLLSVSWSDISVCLVLSDNKLLSGKHS